MTVVPLNHAAEVILGRQRAPQYEEGEGQTPYLRSANIVDGALNLGDVKSMRFSPSERAHYGLKPGDVLVTEGSGSRDTVGASAVWNSEIEGIVCFQNTLLRLRPRPGVLDGHYLAWWARHAHASGLVAAAASGANILHIGAEGMRILAIRLPALHEQRRVADFLDDQVGLVDQVAVVRRDQARLADERFRVSIAKLFNGPTLPLKQYLVQPPCYGVLVPSFVENGVPFVRVGDLSRLQRVRRDELPQIPRELSHEYRRTLVRAGDVLVSVVGSTDKSAVVPETLAGVNIARAVARLVPRADVPPVCITAWMETPSYADQVHAVTSADTAQPTLNMGDLRNFRIALPAGPLTALASRIEDLRQVRDGWRENLGRTLDLLEERKRALITACVTGEFDVSTAGNRASEAAMQGVGV